MIVDKLLYGRMSKLVADAREVSFRIRLRVKQEIKPVAAAASADEHRPRPH